MSCDLQDDVGFFQQLTLLCLKPQRSGWPQRSAQRKPFLLKVNKPQKRPVKTVSDWKQTRRKDFFSNPKPKYLIITEQLETEIADTKSNTGVGKIDLLQILFPLLNFKTRLIFIFSFR